MFYSKKLLCSMSYIDLYPCYWNILQKHIFYQDIQQPKKETIYKWLNEFW